MLPIAYVVVRILTGHMLLIGDFIGIAQSITTFGWDLEWFFDELIAIKEASLYIREYQEYCETYQKTETGDRHLDCSDGFEISFANVGYSYQKGTKAKRALHDVNVTIRNGEVIAVVGENGAGKSTAFKAILGLIHVDDGTVRVMGQDSTGLTPAQKEEIGVVLSDSTFSGYLTVQQISHIMEKMYHRFDRADFLEKCHQLSIPLDRSLKEFSTGMRAKLKVLLALSHEAKLLILDVK